VPEFEAGVVQRHHVLLEEFKSMRSGAFHNPDL
jgi:hypothetical protein